MQRAVDPLTFNAGRCSIRPWCAADEAALVHHADNRHIWRNVRDEFPSPYGREDARRWIAHATSLRPLTQFCIAVGEEAVGGIGVVLQDGIHRKSGEIGYWLGEQYWGKGIMTEAVRAFVPYVMGQFGLCRVYAQVFEWNVGSMRVLEKAGFVCEGRLQRAAVKEDQVIDELLYAKVTG